MDLERGGQILALSGEPAANFASITDAASDLGAYEIMLLIRRFEEKLGLLVALGEMEPTGETWNGKEALHVALALSRRPCDTLVTANDGLSYRLASGAEPQSLLLSLIAARTAPEVVRNGSITLINEANHRVFPGGQERAAGAMAIALGISLANRRYATGAVTVAVLEAQAASNQDVRQLLLQASEWRVPIVAVLEHQITPASTSPADEVTAAEIVRNAHQNGIPCALYDATDINRMRAEFDAGISRASGLQGPSLVFVATHQYQGHSDRIQRNSAGRLPSRAAHDPILRARARLLAAELASEPALVAIEKRVRDRVSAAALAARGESCESSSQRITLAR